MRIYCLISYRMNEVLYLIDYLIEIERYLHFHRKDVYLPQISFLDREFCFLSSTALGQEKRKSVANAMKRVAAGAHLPTPWLFEPAKRPDDRADYCLDCSFRL